MANNHKRCRTEPLLQPDIPIVVQCSLCGKNERLKRMQALPVSKERLALAFPEHSDEVANMKAGAALLISLPPGWLFRFNPATECVELCCNSTCRLSLETRPN